MLGNLGMERPIVTNTAAVPELLHSLCSSQVKNQEQLVKVYRHCLTLLNSCLTTPTESNEFKLCQRIQKKLVVQRREGDALRFTELHRHLKTQTVIQNTTSLLQFMLTLSEESNTLPQDSFLDITLGLPPSLLPSSSSNVTMNGSGSRTLQPPSSTPLDPHRVSKSTSRSLGSSGISSWHSAPEPFPKSQSINLSNIPKSQSQHTSHQLSVPNLSTSSWQHPSIDRGDKDGEISEALLVQDLMFVFQGIDGKYIAFKKNDEGFRVSEKVSVHPAVVEQCHKLAELGWLYRKINNYIKSRTQDNSLGLVMQSFLAALSLELTEYYRLIAVLEAQLSADEGGGNVSERLTLRRLVVWTREPLEKLKILAVLVDGCKGLKGGALVSNLYSYAQHGDPDVKALVKHVLNQVYRPINTLLNAWIFEGQLQDHFNEFFIAADVKTPDDKFWHSKYSIRTNMLPRFISEELAKKILTVGKSINFLRQRCHDHTELFTSDEKEWFKEKDECTFDSMTGSALSAVVTNNYKETSRYLLNVLNTQYRFAEHLKAFRNYLLLGQGDFIQHLMDIIRPELAKPATTCFVHNLTAILESAIRATNAQYDNQDVLNRLDVQLLDPSPGDSGWDVFSLQYRVDGPIGTVFNSDAMLRYLQIFNFLWRAKRIEFTLAGIWRNQMSYHRQLMYIPELHPTLHLCRLVTAALVHFISQLQYFIMFECLECSWADLLKRIDTANDLDEVIAAHSEFLDVIVTRCLLDPHSQPLLTQLRTLFDLIVDYQLKQESMFATFIAEVERRKEYSFAKEDRAFKGNWGETQEETTMELQKRDEFKQKVVIDYHSQFTVLQHSFDDTLKNFLDRIGGHLDGNLRFLVRRLDFNRFYRDPETMSLIM